MLSQIKPDDIGNWVCVYETNMDFDASLIQGYLADQNIPCQILSKKDSSYNTNYGHLSLIYIYVPHDFGDEAKKAIELWQESAGNSNQNNDDPEDTLE